MPVLFPVPVVASAGPAGAAHAWLTLAGSYSEPVVVIHRSRGPVPAGALACVVPASTSVRQVSDVLQRLPDLRDPAVLSHALDRLAQAVRREGVLLTVSREGVDRVRVPGVGAVNCRAFRAVLSALQVKRWEASGVRPVRMKLTHAQLATLAQAVIVEWDATAKLVPAAWKVADSEVRYLMH